MDVSNDADMHEYMHYVSKSQQSRGPKAKIYECMYVMYACNDACMHERMQGVLKSQRSHFLWIA